MPSVSVLIVEKSGEIKASKIKDYAESELYKKAGFKSAEGFKQQTSWAVELEGVQYKVALYAKSSGKAGSENKYDFPPPVDSALFFGACVLVGLRNGELADLSVDQWSKFYEFLFGGFEDLGEDEDDDDDVDTDDEIANIEAELGAKLGKPVTIQTTKEGYIKDDFIVDDDDDEDAEDIISESSDSSYVPPPPKKKRGGGAAANKKKTNDIPIEKTTAQKRQRKTKDAGTSGSKSQDAKVVAVETAVESTNSAGGEYLDCTSELTYEEYVK